MTENTPATNGPSRQIRPSIAEYLGNGKYAKKFEALDNDLKQEIARDITDPMVLKTQWTPIDRFGGTYRSHVLDASQGSRVSFRETKFAKAFALLFIVLGAIAGASAMHTNLARGVLFSEDTAVGLVVCIMFVSFGIFTFVKKSPSIVFDLGRGVFSKSRVNSSRTAQREASRRDVSLRDIYALQLIPAQIRSRDEDGSSEYYTYELILVLRQGERVSVLCHGDRNGLVDDAVQLGRILGKPVWDAIDHSIAFNKANGVFR